MRFLVYFIFLLFLNAQDSYNSLSDAEKHVILDKGTELPFTGRYNNHFETGLYVCKRCNAPLYGSNNKFKSHCGWPSFDDTITGAVKRIPDRDGRRTEIVCANCNAHLGHVFEGEGLTEKNIRHCVNSISMTFIPAKNLTETAYFAGGCFWGVEHHFEKLQGVKSVVSGYMGGRTENPSYREVSRGDSGHLEAVKVEYDPEAISYEELARLFFNIHDPTQADGQGPDIGSQYRSAVFYADEHQKKIAAKLIRILKSKGFDVATKTLPVSTFYPAEKYHQDYYERTGNLPYCHIFKKRL